MLKLRCPECGTNLYEGYLKFPVCHHCGTNALSCRGCASYDPKTGACTDVVSPITTVADADARPECGRFRPLRELREAPADRPATRRLWVYAAIAVVLVLLALVAQQLVARGPQPAEHLMRAAVSLPNEVAVGDPCTVVILADNRAEEQPHTVAVRVSNDTLQDLELQEITPEPARQEDTGGGRTFHFGSVEPGADMQIEFTFLCDRQGRARMSFLVTDEASNLIGQKYEQLKITP